MMTCNICGVRSMRKYSDYAWHHHKDKAVCLECYARQIIREYLERIIFDPKIVKTVDAHLEPETIAQNVWAMYRMYNTCVTCGEKYFPKFDSELLNAIRANVRIELPVFANPIMVQTLGIISELKERNNDLVEQLTFYQMCNENLKVKLTFQ
jgi:hypothetical protein